MQAGPAVVRLARPWRWRELALLLWPAALLGTGMAWLQVTRAGGVDRAGLVGFALFVTVLLGAHVWLSRRIRTGDQVLLPTVAMLCAIGQLMVTRLEPSLAPRQHLWVAIGLVVMAAAAALLPNAETLRQYRYSLAAAGLLLVGVTFLLGVDPNGSGARLWLGVGGVYFQPSELLKVLLVVFFAAYLDENRELLVHTGPQFGRWRLPPPPYLLPILAMFGVSQALLVFQRDLGAALLFFVVFLTMLYIGTGQGIYVVGGLLLFAVGALVTSRLFGYVDARVSTWLDPWTQASGAGYQLVQSLLALRAGGLLGAGLGWGYPTYIPAVHTDFVISAIGEELGLSGTLATVGLFAILVERGYRISLRAADRFQMLLGVGLSTVVGVQALIILFGTLRLMPLTGITLPFISYGGSSILANFLLVGLLHRISAESR
ncbi:MAG: FtsW/RodA/SpoVE family cell cycle protein [Chloroflexi bacterium]|nr:FtsW/RodA/SpoVE family cell cycle protein [Chloroflexota bacterium]